MKAVITCAGKGTRMLPFSKQMPKEMSPIFTKTADLQVKPLIQLIFENLFDVGIREFCFVTGKTKHAIYDHFSPDPYDEDDEPLKNFYSQLNDSNIMWVNQNKPQGFGAAVFETRSYIGNSDFILQAGDVAIIPFKENPLSKLISLSNDSSVDAALLIKKVDDPQRHGIVTLSNDSNNMYRITKAVEKPDVPETNFGIMPVYFFRSNIFDALEKTPPGKNNEVQITDAIQKLIENGRKVVGIHVDNDHVLDVGTPSAFWNALAESYKISTGESI